MCVIACWLQVAGILTGDVKLIGQSLDSDVIIEPVRGPLIPGMMAVKEAAKAAGKWHDECIDWFDNA